MADPQGPWGDVRRAVDRVSLPGPEAARRRGDQRRTRTRASTAVAGCLAVALAAGVAGNIVRTGNTDELNAADVPKIGNQKDGSEVLPSPEVSPTGRPSTPATVTSSPRPSASRTPSRSPSPVSTTSSPAPSRPPRTVPPTPLPGSSPFTPPSRPATSAAGAPSEDVQQPVQRPAADGDVDGDGRRDTARITRRAGEWRLVVDLSSGRTLDAPVAEPAGTTPVIGAIVDADGGGHAEVFVRFDGGASGFRQWTPYRLVVGGFGPLILNGAPVLLQEGRDDERTAGFFCDQKRGVVSVRIGTAIGGGAYHVQRRAFVFRGLGLKDIVAPIEYDAQPGSEVLKRAETADCGTLS